MAESDCYQPVCENDDPIISMKRLVNKRNRLEDFDDDQEAKENVECPIGKSTLGLFTWNLLHTMAIYYPDQPSPE